MNKFERMLQTLPSFYKPQTNVMIRGLISAWAESDDVIVTQLQETKESIFVTTAEGRYLDLLGNSVGVPRTPSLGINDVGFRSLIPTMSFKPKQVRSTIVDLLDIFWTSSYTRANTVAANSETYNFGPATVLTGTAHFAKNSNVVRGVATLFTTELMVGQYIKPALNSGTTYVKVNKIISDTTLELSAPWPYDFAVGVQVAVGTIKELEYIVDERITKTIRFIPNAFEDLTAVTIDELSAFVNSHPEHSSLVMLDMFVDSINGNKLMLLTKTAGIQGSIRVLGGSANAQFAFDLLMHNEVKAGVFEINPNEVIVLTPRSVPIIRNTLKGSTHLKQIKTETFSVDGYFDFSGLGVSSTLNITVDGTPYVVTFTHANFNDVTNVSAREVADAINGQLAFLEAFSNNFERPKAVGLRTSSGSEEYQVTGGTANTVLNFVTTLQQDEDIIRINYPSPYIYAPTTQSFTLTEVKSDLTEAIVADTVITNIKLSDASSFPNQSGKFILDFGKPTEEGPIEYNGRLNNTTLAIDASYVFQKDHGPGTTVNFVLSTPTVPRINGDDYAAYIIGVEEARLAIQGLIRKLVASGVVIRFITNAVEVLFQCLCDECGAPVDPDYRGSLTESGPLAFW